MLFLAVMLTVHRASWFEELHAGARPNPPPPLAPSLFQFLCAPDWGKKGKPTPWEGPGTLSQSGSWSHLQYDFTTIVYLVLKTVPGVLLMRAQLLLCSQGSIVESLSFSSAEVQAQGSV